MKAAPSPGVKKTAKAPTGIAGFDEITGGGLPRGRTTLLVGGPGSGKTILALQFLVHGARKCKEPGIFVAFEENATRIVANAESFGWNLAELQGKKLTLMDAQPAPDVVQSGDFDLRGMLAALDAQIKATGARRIVFDALNIALALLPDAAAIKRELYRLHDWLLARELTAILTLQAGAEETGFTNQQPFGFVQFMVDCAVILNHTISLGVSQRNLRVQKYRGAGFDEDEAPFRIGKNGFEVALTGTKGQVESRVTNERVSSGVARLDAMLGGGFYRGASVLITGFAGTGKTTLSGAFAEAACRRGERTLFVSFDSGGLEVIRNLASVSIRLERFVKNGCLRILSARGIAGSAHTYLERIKTCAIEHGARNMVIDPMSTWSAAAGGIPSTAHGVADRLIDWSKARGITLLCTRLVDDMFGAAEASSPLQISTLVDTWVHLNYLLRAGERNRCLSIIKSRGTAHSNQVRELILSDAGVSLVDLYSAGGEAWTGSLRWEKESAERIASEVADTAAKLIGIRLDAEAAELEARSKSLRVELAAKQAEKALLVRAAHSRDDALSRGRARMRALRGADAAPAPRK